MEGVERVRRRVLDCNLVSSAQSISNLKVKGQHSDSHELTACTRSTGCDKPYINNSLFAWWAYKKRFNGAQLVDYYPNAMRLKYAKIALEYSSSSYDKYIITALTTYTPYCTVANLLDGIKVWVI